MAARLTKWTPDIVRQRIKTAHIVKVLQGHIFDGVELSRTQLKAAEILLRKTLPDQTSVAHSGEIGQRRPEEMSRDELLRIAAGGSEGDSEPGRSETEPSELH